MGVRPVPNPALQRTRLRRAAELFVSRPPDPTAPSAASRWRRLLPDASSSMPRWCSGLPRRPRHEPMRSACRALAAVASRSTNGALMMRHQGEAGAIGWRRWGPSDPEAG